MSTGARVVGVSLLVLVLGGGAYGTADAYDVVPGVVTLAPVPPDPEPFPAVPGVAEPPAVAPALGPLDAAAPVPDPAQVAALVQGLVTDGRIGPGVGVVVADQITGDVLASHASDQPRVPASTAKLVTGVAALATLDPASTLDTRVVRGDGDEVVLVGGGDMMLAPGAGDPDAVVGHAGLGDLAAQVAGVLASTGTTSVRLGYDASLFSGPALSPTWKPSDVNQGFVAPVTSVAVDIAKIRPGEYPPRHADPAANAAQVLAQRLAENGVTVTGVGPVGPVPAGAEQLGLVRSAPLSDVVHYFLDTSDNTITEVVARLVAIDAGLPGSFEGASQAVLREAAQLGVDTSGAQLVDASGLGTGSQLTPDLLLGLLRLVTDPTHPELREIATGMPVAGLTGTLAERYTTTSARGLVRAKTGSLPGVTSLAGTVVDADGRQLLFAVLADQTPGGGQPAPRAAIDGFVARLAECGCR